VGIFVAQPYGYSLGLVVSRDFDNLSSLIGDIDLKRFPYDPKRTADPECVTFSPTGDIIPFAE